jgi:hypothetical protein
MSGRGNLLGAGLVLIPVGIVLLVLELTVAGAVCLGAGWLLVLAALVSALRSPSESLTRRGPTPVPTFVVATALAGAAVAAEEPLAGVAIGYVAVLWFCIRFWR